jgi:integrase
MLTDVAISKLTPRETRREVPDGKIAGLYLVLQPSGAKSWALRYRAAGVPKKLTIGTYPGIGVAAARARAQKALAQVVDGNDPAAAKKAAREAAKAAAKAAEDRVEDVVDGYVARYLTRKVGPGWAREAERLLRREIVPLWGERRLSEITPRDLGKRLGEIAERGAPITANRTLAAFRRMCRWASSATVAIIETDPCRGVEMPAEEHSRERVLSDHEIQLAWNAFQSAGTFGQMCKLLLLTRSRREEARAMTWNEVDLDHTVWLIPGTRTKNGKPHEIPLSSTAVEILRGLKRIERKRGPDGRPQPAFVFTVTGNAPLGGISEERGQLNAKIVELMRAEAIARGEDPAGIVAPDWTLHDLRRTVATNLQKLGVRLEVTEAVLGHKGASRAGIVGVYQRYS